MSRSGSSKSSRRSKIHEIQDAEAYLSQEDVLKIRPASEFGEKYEIIKKLGHGAFAEVFLIKNRETGEQYAAKMIDRTAVANPKHLWNELHLLYRLDFPSIVHLYDAYASERHLLMVLEYAQGGELYDRISQREEFLEWDAVAIIQELLKAVKYLHDNKVVHRDIKPENILFMDQSDDTMKLSDFGLSGVLKADTMLYTCAGTPGFMAPEVIKGSSGSGYGEECDMWSVGVLAYLLLSGTMPFKSHVPFQLYKNILSANYEFGEEFECVSDEAKDFIKKCLLVNPKERITAGAALEHEWFAEPQLVQSRSINLDCRDRLLDLLEERRNMKQYKAAGMAVNFVAKMRAKAKSAKKLKKLSV